MKRKKKILIIVHQLKKNYRKIKLNKLKSKVQKEIKLKIHKAKIIQQLHKIKKNLNKLQREKLKTNLKK